MVACAGIGQLRVPDDRYPQGVGDRVPAQEGPPGRLSARVLTRLDVEFGEWRSERLASAAPCDVKEQEPQDCSAARRSMSEQKNEIEAKCRHGANPQLCPRPTMEAYQRPWARQHTKSRTGCRRCKLRKVKCDEAHPECRNCQRLGARCSYIERRGGGRESEARVVPALSAQPAPRPCRVRDEGTSRLLELRLLHDFATVGRDTLPFPEDERIARFWTVLVPRMGFEHEFLLDAILGTAALQTAARQSPPDPRLAAAGHRYYSRAVSQQRAALASLDHRTAEPLCVASILIMLMTFKVYSRRSTATATAAEPYAPPAHWFRMVQGMGGLIRHCYALLDDDGIRLLMHKVHPTSMDGPDRATLPQLPDLGKLLHTDFDGDAGLKHSLLQFARLLRCCLAAASCGASRSEIRYELLGFVAQSDNTFLQLVEQAHPLTIILLSHYFTLLRWSGGNWWLHNELDAELGNMYHSIPEQYKWAITL